MKRSIVGLVVLGLGLAACEAEQEPAPEVSTRTQEVVAFDWCAFLGWYGDGDCHWYCPQVNPDCEPPPPGDHCGGFGAEECDADEWCDFPPDAVCNFADASGECKPRPEACTTQYDPVCGCNGQTYSNACNAHASGTDTVADGPCEAPPGPSCAGHCGNQSDGDCWCDEHCDYYGDCCADLQDVCGWSP